MKDIWFFSDHHFGQENILKFTDIDGNLIRPGFSSVDEMDTHMIECWNKSIRPGDHVWHLGDISFDDQKFANNISKKLHGKLRIVIGNHDDIKFLAGLSRIQKLVEARRFDEFGFIASHRPLHAEGMWNHRSKKPLFNIHGHLHSQNSPSDMHLNLCVEKTSYKPVHIDEIIEKVSKTDAAVMPLRGFVK